MSESVTTQEHALGHNRRRRPTGARRATFGAVALILGGSGLVAVNVFASATESGNAAVPLGSSGVAATVDCPDPAERLTAVPERARPEVDKELAHLDGQIAAAYAGLQEAARTADDGTLDEAAILDPLKKERTATLERIAAAIGKAGDRPEGLDTLAECTLRRTEIASTDAGSGSPDRQGEGKEQDQGQGQDQSQGQGQKQEDGEGEASGDGQQQPGNGGQAGNGPVAADYVDIESVRPNVVRAPLQEKASTGSFATSCGVNAEGLFNSDNLIAAPGVGNGAHHFHDYVGNQANDAFASDEDLAAGDTSCADQGDKSSYYWPVLRLQNGTAEQDAQSPGGGVEGNAGEIVTPAEVTLTFEGNERGKVTGMPRLLRIITGDAKAFVNGDTNANASWSCTGFEDRQLKDKYPLCPSGSDVVRTFTFQSCWDGRNIDSANHRTHMAFAAADGSCPEGFRAVPRLVQRVVYDVAAPSLEDGGKTVPLFAVDSFPEQLHKPVTDHSDFINVFDEDLMREMVECINSGRECGPDTPPGAEPGEGGEQPGGNGDGQTAEPPAEQTATASAPADTGQDGENGQDGQDGQPGGEDNGKNPGQNESRNDGQPGADETAPPAAESRGTEASASAEPRAATTAAEAPDDATRAVAPPEKNGDAGNTGDTGSGGNGAGAGSAPEPQAQGGLAETGSGLGLWPAAVGGVLFAGGCVLLVRSRRRAP
ncbi:DUF1996 domain-containing protein [Streptomyces coelicoflavus]|uniref:DUF1996 domain-containing protein n=1 Tax=Streptomyces coelicoflavus TaxID=285562 RepID=A0A7K3PTX6_9ACTN|nr:DUF1996 domain-containing protein [Streptomyces coelicoflavus]NEB12821.1 DUF1996 domain-containing protein [Streptomyces coelicoflavus]